ncbi:unnamed protein product, partial [Symbiodinium necroappetens]
MKHFASYGPRPEWKLDIKAVPTLLQVESTIRSLQKNKAAGADSVTSELLRAHAPATSRQLLPVLAKASLRALEPVAFRGGELFLLAKKGMDLISLVAKTFFVHANVQHQAAALVFFDLKAACYQVLRQALVETCDSDASLLRLFHALNIPPAAICELKEHLAKASLLVEAQVSAHTRALVTDLFEGTYFRLSTSADLTLTGRGSRPGDPMADILFAFTLSAFVKSSQVELGRRGLLADWPMQSTRPDFIAFDGPVFLSCPAWADDFFLPQSSHTFAGLVQHVVASVEVLQARATAAGMTVKYGEDKTAVLFPAELLARHSSLLDTAEGGLGLYIRDSQAGRHFLPAVQAYKHLGGILTSDANPMPDLHLRFAHAMGVLRPLRKRLFGALRFDLAVRRNLLRSLAVSRYVHSASSLIFPAPSPPLALAKDLVSFLPFYGTTGLVPQGAMRLLSPSLKPFMI